MKQFKNPKKYSGAWNFGTEKNSITSVKKIVEFNKVLDQVTKSIKT